MTAERVRLFAALELPGDVRSALSSWAARASSREPAIRVLSPAALHVTLVFVGPQAADEAEEIGAALLSECRPLAPLAVNGAAWLPPRRPGVLVADLIEDGDRLLALQRDVSEALAPWHEPETRPFRPHVTVARVRHGHRIGGREVPAPPRLTFDATALVLYRSELGGPGGARYEAVARRELR